MAEDAINPRRRGKIALCPRHIREEICRMLDDGRQGPEILAWANAQPEVQALLMEKFEGEAISDNNLSQWFKGGFQDWREAQSQIDHTRGLAELSMDLAKSAGGNMSEGVLAIAAGRIMSVLETADPDKLTGLVLGATAIRSTEQTQQKIALAKHRNDQRDRQLELETQKFHRLAVGKFIDWAENEKAREIATSDAPREVKMDQLITLMFGQRPVTPPA